MHLSFLHIFIRSPKHINAIPHYKLHHSSALSLYLSISATHSLSLSSLLTRCKYSYEFCFEFAIWEIVVCGRHLWVTPLWTCSSICNGETAATYTHIHYIVNNQHVPCYHPMAQWSHVNHTWWWCGYTPISFVWWRHHKIRNRDDKWQYHPFCYRPCEQSYWSSQKLSYQIAMAHRKSWIWIVVLSSTASASYTRIFIFCVSIASSLDARQMTAAELLHVVVDLIFGFPEILMRWDKSVGNFNSSVSARASMENIRRAKHARRCFDAWIDCIIYVPSTVNIFNSIPRWFFFFCCCCCCSVSPSATLLNWYNECDMQNIFSIIIFLFVMLIQRRTTQEYNEKTFFLCNLQFDRPPTTMVLTPFTSPPPLSLANCPLIYTW